MTFSKTTMNLFFATLTTVIFSNAHAVNLCDYGKSIAQKTQMMGLIPGKTAWVDYLVEDFRDEKGFSKNFNFELGGWGWGNYEPEYYTNSPRNYQVKKKEFQIIARKEFFEKDGQKNDYTSARVFTKEAFVYGRFEVQARLPKGKGLWPAIWMLPREVSYGTVYWPDQGEIDIMEHWGKNPKGLFSVVHTNARNHMHGNSPPNYVEFKKEAGDDDHTFAVEWSPRSLVFFVDGQRTGEYKNEGTGWKQWPFDKPFELILNLALGGPSTDNGMDESVFPAIFKIKSVKVSAPVGGDFCQKL